MYRLVRTRVQKQSTPNMNLNGGSSGLTNPLTENLDADTNKIIGLGEPTLAQDATTKNYVDNQIALIPSPDLSDLVSKTTLTPQSIASSLTTNGDVQLNTGALQINNSTVQIQNSGTCQIQPTGILSLKEFSTTGNITMGGTAQIKNLAPGVALTDAVNLSQIPAPVSLVALETKTQNIDLTTSSGNTDITGTITLNNELTIPVVTSRNTNNYIVGDGGTGLTGTGEYNMVFGNGLAGNALTTGDKNVIVGAFAGELLDTGDKNVLIGTNTGDLLTSGGFNTIVGHGAGASGTTPLSSGEDNLLLGTFSNIDDNTNENIAIGARATASGGRSIALGARATTTASQQLMIGGPGSSNSINTVVPGYITCDLGSNTNKFKDLYLSGQALVGGETTIPVVTSRNTNNYIVGAGGTGLTGTGEYNMVFGNGLAGDALTTGDKNVIVGAFAGELLDTGEKNVLIGTNTGDLLTSGGFNTIVGHGAGASGTTPLSTGEDNVLLGTFSNIDDNTNENIAIGARATASGGRSIALGARATTTASQQLMIGGPGSSNSINTVVPGYITCDLGSTANKFKDIYLSGKVETPSILADDIQITGTNTLTIDSALLLVDTVLFASDFVKYTGVSYLNPSGDNSLSAVGYVKQETALKLSIDGSNAMTGTLTTTDIVPSVTDTWDIGTNVNRYENIYGQNLDASNEIVCGIQTIATPTTRGTFDATANANLYEDSYIILKWDGNNKQPRFEVKTGFTGYWDVSYEVIKDDDAIYANQDILTVASTNYYFTGGTSADSGYAGVNYSTRFNCFLHKESGNNAPSYDIIVKTGSINGPAVYLLNIIKPVGVTFGTASTRTAIAPPVRVSNKTLIQQLIAHNLNPVFVNPVTLQNSGGTELNFIRDISDNKLTINENSITCTKNPASSTGYKIRMVSANPLSFETSNTERMRITKDGFIGIGTSSPSNMLHMKDTGGLAEIQLERASDNKLVIGSNSINITKNPASSAGYSIGTVTGNKLVFKTSNTDHLIIDPNGNIDVPVSLNTPVIKVENSSDPSPIAGKSLLYSKDVSASSELFCMDEAGNSTRLSSHNASDEWEYLSKTTGGLITRINMIEVIQVLEELTGKTLIHHS